MTCLGQGGRLMTGATGFVGSHFLRSWLRAGQRVVALARPGRETAATRVNQALRAAASTLAAPAAVPAATAFAADLAQVNCGLDSKALAQLRAAKPNELWHFAASLQYEDRHRAAIFEANVQGTRRALSLSQALGCEWFVYVSTAYTAGTRRGTIAEALPAAGTTYNNCYEASKAEAERLVADECARHGMRYAILRPSIVIGPSCSKSTGGSVTGLYGFAREVGRARAALRGMGQPLRLRGEPETELNLLPIDWFIADVEALLSERVERDCIRHHTLEGSPTIRQVGEAMSDLLGLPGFDLSPQAEPATALERVMARRTAFYGAYLSGSKRFERSRAFPQQISDADLREYLAGCLGESEVIVRSARMGAVASRSRAGR